MIIRDLRKIYLFNSLIVYGVFTVAIVAIIANIYLAKNILTESREYIYVLASDGEIIPTRIAQANENRIIEAQHHIKMLVDYFYNLNQNNIQGEANCINKALWLGDLKAADDYRKTTKFYDRIIQYSLKYTTNIEKMEVTPHQDVMNFRCIIRIQITGERGIIPEEYFEELTGILKITNRNFPYNPHGLFIEEFVAKRLK